MILYVIEIIYSFDGRRWLQVAFAPPTSLWRAEGAGAALISESEALKAGAAVTCWGVQASRAAPPACPPINH